MAIRIRKGLGGRRRIFLREWREHLHKTNPNITAQRLADRLEIERESYYRIERQPWTLSGAEILEIEEAMDLEPGRLFRPPPRSDDPPSLDAIAHGAPRDQIDMAADVVRRIVGRTS